MIGHPRIGELLVEDGLATTAQIAQVLDAQGRDQTHRRRFGKVALELGWLEERQLAEALARQFDLPFVDLHDTPIDATAADVLSPENALRLHVLPISVADGRLVLAVADPTDVIALDDVRLLSSLDVSVVVSTESAIREGLERLKRMDNALQSLFTGTDMTFDQPETVEASAPDGPAVKAIDRIITRAVGERASDVHIEPWESDALVRYRVDGVLRDVTRIPKRLQESTISRIKVMANLNIAEKRVPQDGRVTVTTEGERIDLRVATLPSRWGEKVAIRLLPRSASRVGLDELGLDRDTLDRYHRLFGRANGAVLVTGPTGSGKSTTLYATLNVLNSAGKSIVTVEDPVEYLLPRVMQVQVNPQAGLTFASGLRSILRCDPDIVMVGEIRDRETAMIAMEAALTGHLVLSTLHTNDAPSALTRLIEMGVEPFVVASAVQGVVAQRLVRRLCERCREVESPRRAEAICARFPALDAGGQPQLYRPVGCHSCSHIGYRGRVALVEMMPVTEQIEQLTMLRRPSEEIGRTAIAESGMRLLIEDGVEKVRAGITTAAEVLRVVVGNEQADALAEDD